MHLDFIFPGKEIFFFGILIPEKIDGGIVRYCCAFHSFFFEWKCGSQKIFQFWHEVPHYLPPLKDHICVLFSPQPFYFQECSLFFKVPSCLHTIGFLQLASCHLAPSCFRAFGLALTFLHLRLHLCKNNLQALHDCMLKHTSAPFSISLYTSQTSALFALCF